jgi:hypothetical protein
VEAQERKILGGGDRGCRWGRMVGQEGLVPLQLGIFVAQGYVLLNRRELRKGLKGLSYLEAKEIVFRKATRGYLIIR